MTTKTRRPTALDTLRGTKNVAEICQRDPHPDLLGALIWHVPSGREFLCTYVTWGGSYDGKISHTLCGDDGSAHVPARDCTLILLDPGKRYPVMR